MDTIENQNVSLEQFFTLLSQKQLSIYKKKEELDIEMREYYNLCENLIQFTLSAEKQIRELTGKNEALKKQVTELQQKSNNSEG